MIIFKMHFPVILFCSVLWLLCYLLGYRSAVQQDNRYTMNHYKYVALFFGLILKFIASVFAYIFLLSSNIGITNETLRYKCCYVAYEVIFYSIRFILFGYMTYTIIKDIIYLMVRTITIVRGNWWQHEDEPFLTNCSLFTAAVCWLIWICVLNLIVVFYLYYILRTTI